MMFLLYICPTSLVYPTVNSWERYKILVTHTVRKLWADFAVLYGTDDAIASSM